MTHFKYDFHITTGDIDGIGLEVCLKALSSLQEKLTPYSRYFIWVDNSQKDFILDFHKDSLLKNSFLFTSSFSSAPTKEKYIYILNPSPKPAHWFKRAVEDALVRKTPIITGPLSKPQIISEGVDNIGHTDILKTMTQSSSLFMSFIGHFFNVVLYSDHIPINNISLDQNTYLSYTQLAHKTSLVENTPLIQLGLNPHAGDQGLIGAEDNKIKAWIHKTSFPIAGPIPSDSAFINFKSKPRSTYLAMYHDQGLIPFKMAHGFSGYHCTLGLPFVRTSVDHGTAKDIFGQNKGDETSMKEAIVGAYKLKTY